MANFVVEASFLASAYGAPKETSKKIWKALHLLASNPQHPSLHLENLKGNASGLQSVRVDDKYRIIIAPSDSGSKLLYVGVHDEAYAFAEKTRAPVPVSGEPRVLYSMIPRPPAIVLPENAVRDLLIRTIKYLPLAIWLMDRSEFEQSIYVTFKEVEQLIHGALPKSARNHRVWWANEKGGGRHVQANAWMVPGWKVTSVDLTNENVTFSRVENRLENIRVGRDDLQCD